MKPFLLTACLHKNQAHCEACHVINHFSVTSKGGVMAFCYSFFDEKAGGQGGGAAGPRGFDDGWGHGVAEWFNN